MTDDDLRAIFDPVARLQRYNAWKAAQLGPPCEYEGTSSPCNGSLHSVPPMSHYGDEPEMYTMCAYHRDDYVQHWSAMWEEYYASQGWG